MYGKLECSRCTKPYVPGHEAFCDPCLESLSTDAGAAEAHLKKIMAGDINEVPESPEEHRKVRAAIKQNLRDNGSKPDSAPMKRYDPRRPDGGKTHDQSNR